MYSKLAIVFVTVASATGTGGDYSNDVFPIRPAVSGGEHFTYMSVANPEALNLDGSRYGIAVCLSTVSKANWTFSAGEKWISPFARARCSPSLE